MDTVQQTREALIKIGKVYDYILHPSLIWDFIVDISFWVAAIGGVIAIIIYVCGFEKALKYTYLLAVIYTLIKGINGVI